jgi:integrase
VDEAPVAFKLDPDELARVKSKPQSVAAVEKKSNTVKRAPGKTGRGSPLKGKADAGSKDSRSFDNWAELQRAMTGEIKRRNYSPKTLSGYMKWVRQFGEFTDHMPVEEISDESARDFLTHLAVNGHVVASTQNQAFNALLFLFRHILKRDYELGDSVTRAKVSKYIPTVLTRSEVDAVLANLKFPHNLIVSMLYGCGLRLSECLELRMGDLDFMQARHGACFPAQLCEPFAGG